MLSFTQPLKEMAEFEEIEKSMVITMVMVNMASIMAMVSVMVTDTVMGSIR